jgi:hypothetical protein
MRFGYWMPIFGGWLRNVADEQMPVAWPYLRDLAVASEDAGFSLSLIAELNLNDIKGHRAPSLDCWTLAPAIAAATRTLELMLAVRPNYPPRLTAKALSTLDVIAPGRVSLNVVSSGGRTGARSTARRSTCTTPGTRTQMAGVGRLLRGVPSPTRARCTSWTAPFSSPAVPTDGLYGRRSPKGEVIAAQKPMRT